MGLFVKQTQRKGGQENKNLGKVDTQKKVPKFPDLLTEVNTPFSVQERRSLKGCSLFSAFKEGRLMFTGNFKGILMLEGHSVSHNQNQEEKITTFWKL